MNHLTEEELIEYHYGEGGRHGQHLANCSACSTVYEVLRDDLASLGDRQAWPGAAPRGEQYGESVWRRLRPSLVPQKKSQRAWFRFSVRSGWRFAAVSAALLLAAFFAGRLWQAKHAPAPLAANRTAVSPQTSEQTRERIIVLVLADHLDRSERLLVELSHPEQAAEDPALQATARELLAENRLYRQSARHAAESGASTADMQSLDGTLDDLQPLLVEVANDSKGLSLEQIRQLRKEMNPGALLFEVQVMRTRMQQQARGSLTSKEGSV